MKIVRRQLNRIISELHPRDVADAEYDHLQDLGDMYSDMHKELYGRRPKIPMFKTIEEAEAAVDKIWAEYAEVNRAKDELVQQDLEFQEMERRKQELMPGEHDIELPMHSGMGRRQENRMRVTKRQLKRIIKEERTKLEEDEGRDEMSTNSSEPNNEHHWPRVEWTNVETLTDKWAAAEREAWDKGDPSMNPDKPEDQSQAAWDAEMKSRWFDQVEEASLDFEAELTKRVRKLALQTMQEFTDNLIGGEYL